MQAKTSGIVLHSIKHSDSSSIITVLTREFGRASYMVYGANKKKSIVRASFLQPLSIVDLDVIHSPGKEIQRIKDIRMEHPFHSIPFDPAKNAIALFVAEVLYRCLRHSDADENLFEFVSNSIRQLDLSDEGTANFHLIFMMKLSRYLGFEPHVEDDTGRYFDLQNGTFQNQRPVHTQYLKDEEATLFSGLIEADFTAMNKMVVSRNQRAKLLENLILYYKLQLHGFNGLQSLPVLQALFD